MSALSIYAGPTALARIREEGFHEHQFKVLAGASGGPKWFVLYGLDRYLFGEFFKHRSDELVTLGSSAGAWRMCCLATSNPVAAIDRLAHLYSHESYSTKPTVGEITDKARAMLDLVIGAEGPEEIIANKLFRTHIIASRGRGIGSSRVKALQMIALASSAVANVASRRALSLFYERAIFSNMGQLSPYADLVDLKTSSVELKADNVQEAMIASGAIPFVLEGVRDIKGAGQGLYWDGGITDYHLDIPFHEGPELVLYPHFSASVIPGWFDKKLVWRKVKEDNFHNVVMLTPSKEFVRSLPHGKIPDRVDFQRLDYEDRVKYWQQVLDRSKALAEEFAALVDTGRGLDSIQPFASRDR